MSQQDVYQFLESHPHEWFYSQEISEITGMSKKVVFRSLMKLRRADVINYKGRGVRGDGYLYRAKEWFNMGQHEVYEFLKENPNRWFSAREISEKLGQSFGSTTMALRRLRQENEIAYMGEGHVGSEYRYRYK